MKCVLKREQLLEPISNAEKTTVKNHTLSVLSCVLLEVNKNKLYISATNLEVGIRFVIDVKGSEDGVVAVSGSVLSHIISSFPNGTEMKISTNEGYLIIDSNEGVSKIALQEKEDFPVLPEIDGDNEIMLPADKLKEAVSSVVYCASTSTIKPELASVFVHPNGSELVTVATDSFRLAEKKVTLKNNIDAEPFLIPAKSTPDLLRVLESVKGDVKLNVNKHQLYITLPNVYLTLRLVAGTFPDYTQIIPKEFETEVNVLIFDFERTMRKATVFRDQFNQTTLTISPKDKKFVIHTKNDTVGETKDLLSANITGNDIAISFNQRYLMDSLHSINSDSITLQFAGHSKPAIVRPVNNDGFLYLVMPMNR